MPGLSRWWRLKSTPEKVETYTRWSFHFCGACETAGIGLTTYMKVGPPLATVWALMVVTHAVACTATVARALDWALGHRARPVRELWGLGVLTAVLAVVSLVIGEHGPAGENVESTALGVFVGLHGFGVGVMALAVRHDRWRVIGLVSGSAAGAGVMACAVGLPWPAALATSGLLLVAGAFLAATGLFSVWLLKTVHALDDAEEARVRLAVAEERLRFGRDLHDVMGRNLAVIALKSELAVRLSRRGRPEAVERMSEVQRLAQESQREVRDVVLGYRKAALEVELAGARGVLSAAGIEAVVIGETAGLTAEVQSALGWVVREATTNVLRHGDAQKVAVTVRTKEGWVVLTVENDGVTERTGEGPPAGSGGSGLAGLRERLSAVDGTLKAGPVGKGMFLLTAAVPLPAAAAGTALEVAS
ncbi:sensor histidine kinase [Streptomyces sp. NPDC059459]|uniref:sensor histidine kinase n=1 Tax=unclassified Streptomyces TaxID=2593676 RepID=UPI003697ECEB